MAIVEHNPDLAPLLNRYRERQSAAAKYVDAYRRYCWPVRSIDDLKLAPFHLLATEGKVHVDRDHVWHMETLKRLCEAGGDLLLATAFQVVDLFDPVSEQRGIAWWEELISRGGEGMVVKPLEFITRGPCASCVFIAVLLKECCRCR